MGESGKRLSKILLLSAGCLGFVWASAVSEPQFLRRFQNGLRDLSGIAFTPDSRTLLTSGGGSSSAWDARTGKRLWSLESQAAGELALSPNARLVAIDRHSSAVSYPYIGLYEVRSGQKLLAFKIQNAYYAARLAWSPNGQWLAISTGSDVRLHRTGNGQQLRILEPVCRAALSVAWRPATNELALSCFDGTIELYTVGGTEYEVLTERKILGAVQRWMFTHPDRRYTFNSHSLAFSPDGSLIAQVLADRVTILESLTGVVVKEFTPQVPAAPANGSGGFFDNIAWSTDASMLALTGYKRRLSLYSASTGEFLRGFGGPSTPSAVQFSPDASMLVTGYGSPEDLFLNAWGSSDGTAIFTAEKLK